MSLGKKKRSERNVVQDALTRLRKRREELGLSQAQVAEAARVNASYVGLLERGERVPSVDVLLELCNAVGLAPAELFADTSPEPHKEIPEVAQIQSLLGTWPPSQRQAVVRVIKEMSKLRST